eukprot:11017900-Lingulodinium_polyedra.AAC.1
MDIRECLERATKPLRRGPRARIRRPAAIRQMLERETLPPHDAAPYKKWRYKERCKERCKERYKEHY